MIETVTIAVTDGFSFPYVNAKCNASGLVGSYPLNSNVVLNHVLGQLFYSIINRLFFCIFQCVHLYQTLRLSSSVRNTKLPRVLMYVNHHF